MTKAINAILYRIAPSYRNHVETTQEVLRLRETTKEQSQKIEELAREMVTLSASARNAHERAADTQRQFNEYVNRPCPTCDTLKQTVNFHVLAAGSRVRMFDGIGPTLPEPKKIEMTKPIPTRASQVARAGNRNFINEFLKQQEAPEEEKIG